MNEERIGETGDAIARAVRQCGVTTEQATDRIRVMLRAVQEVPFPDGRELRIILLRAWARDWGIFRFCHYRFWKVVYS